MAQTYDEFKDYIRSFLWKPNDSALFNDLDKLIKLATTELDKKLTLDRRETVLQIDHAGDGTNVVPLPADFKHMIALNSDRYGYVTVTEWQTQFQKGINPQNNEMPYYSVVGGELRLSHSIPLGTTLTLYLTYRTKLPDYMADDASWVEDEYLDVLTYATLKHTAPWLREDERIQVWAEYYKDALGSAIEEDVHEIEYGGTPNKMNMPYKASPRVRGHGRGRRV